MTVQVIMCLVDEGTYGGYSSHQVYLRSLCGMVQWCVCVCVHVWLSVVTHSCPWLWLQLDWFWGRGIESKIEERHGECDRVRVCVCVREREREIESEREKEIWSTQLSLPLAPHSPLKTTPYVCLLPRCLCTCVCVFESPSLWINKTGVHYWM